MSEQEISETEIETNERKAMYSKFRDELYVARRAAFEQFDKAILTLSSGLLGISIGFFKEIAPIDRVIKRELLVCSWVLFGLAILITLGSFMLSQRAIDRQLEDASDYYLKRIRAALDRKNPYSFYTQIANLVSGICFVVAVSLTVYFAAANLMNIR